MKKVKNSSQTANLIVGVATGRNASGLYFNIKNNRKFLPWSQITDVYSPLQRLVASKDDQNIEHFGSELFESAWLLKKVADRNDRTKYVLSLDFSVLQQIFKQYPLHFIAENNHESSDKRTLSVDKKENSILHNALIQFCSVYNAEDVSTMTQSLIALRDLHRQVVSGVENFKLSRQLHLLRLGAEIKFLRQYVDPQHFFDKSLKSLNTQMSKESLQISVADFLMQAVMIHFSRFPSQVIVNERQQLNQQTVSVVAEQNESKVTREVPTALSANQLSDLKNFPALSSVSTNASAYSLLPITGSYDCHAASLKLMADEFAERIQTFSHVDDEVVNKENCPVREILPIGTPKQAIKVQPTFY